MLRDYQQSAHDSAWQFIKRSTDPCLIEAATGAGKSHIIAALAHTVHTQTGKHVLCLAPSGELVEQNHEKYLATGNKASIMSASVGSVSMAHPVVFGTPGTVKNRVRRFGDKIGVVIVDECHKITPTIKHIIERLREHNPRLRVVGLSATPYRLGEGYVYALNEDGSPVGADACRDPYFVQKVYTVGAAYLIERGYLSPPTVGAINAQGYDTTALELNKRGQFDAKDVDRAYHGHGRKTSAVVADVVAQSRNRKGVMLFCATIQHAQEALASLPPSLSAMVDGGTSKADRRRILRDFKARKIKYLVNVAVLTTGFDAPHVDVIALLRLTESVALLQQIIGRGLRKDEGKTDCLVLDYAGNVDRHCPDGDIFRPIIKAVSRPKDYGEIKAECATCGTVNTFAARKNEDGFKIDKEGYFIDLRGQRVGDPPMPAHYGRRCQGMDLVEGQHVQCSQRWSLKTCPQCGEENDIAARYCSSCRAELVDPGEKLIAEFRAMKRDPSKVQVDEVLEWKPRRTVSRSGNEVIRTDIVTPYRSFSVWFHPESKWPKQAQEYREMMAATQGGRNEPETVTYFKDESKFYKILAYNQPADRCEVP
jgi:DNA repair protein RadD